MNIWIVSHYTTTPRYSGSSRHFDFSKELLKRGHSVTIFASSIHYQVLKETINYSGKRFVIEEIEGIRFVWIKSYPYNKNNWKRFVNMLSFSMNTYKIAKKIGLEKPSILFGSSIHLFAVYTAHLLSKKFRVPLVMEVRDLWPETLIDFGFSRWHPLVIVLAFLEKFLYKRSKKIISLLPNAGKYIETLGIPTDKIVYIPNGVDLEKFAPTPGEQSTQNNQLESPFYVTYAGAIGIPNNIVVLIAAAEQLYKEYPKIKFLIVGAGREKARLIETVRRKGLLNVEFRDPVPKKNLVTILKNSEILFAALKGVKLFEYGISLNKLFDYMAAGKPVITSINSSNNPVKEANAGICVLADRHGEIADAIIKLYQLPGTERHAMGERGFEFVKKNYSIPILTDKLENLLLELTK